MIERTIVSLIGGLIAAVVLMIGIAALLYAYDRLGPSVPIAAFVAGASSLWVVDWLSDYMSARAKR